MKTCLFYYSLEVNQPPTNEILDYETMEITPEAIIFRDANGELIKCLAARLWNKVEKYQRP